MTDDAVIALENVGLRYGTGPEILRDVTFQVAPNSFQFLTGPSGAGKTTLMRLLSLALRPTRGFLSLFGDDVALVDRHDVASFRREIGVVFQDFRLLDHLSLFDNVALPMRLRGQSVHQYRADVIELLKWVNLESHRDAFPPVLSGGEKQRVAIARAIISGPKLLLADEPTGNVDPPMAERLMHLFQQLKGIGTSVVIATHDEALMDRTAARRLVLNNGIVEDRG